MQCDKLAFAREFLDITLYNRKRFWHKASTFTFRAKPGLLLRHGHMRDDFPPVTSSFFDAVDRIAAKAEPISLAICQHLKQSVAIATFTSITVITELLYQMSKVRLLLAQHQQIRLAMKII